MKPTPPFKIMESPGLVTVLDARNSTVAEFRYYDDDHRQARANAEAWIAGVAAIEKLAKVRDVIVGYEGDKFSEEAALFQIRKIIDES